MKLTTHFLGFTENSAFILKTLREFNEKCDLSLFSQYFLLCPSAVFSSLPPAASRGVWLKPPNSWCQHQLAAGSGPLGSVGREHVPNAQSSSLTGKPGGAITSEKPACSFQNPETGIYRQNFALGNETFLPAAAFLRRSLGFPACCSEHIFLAIPNVV